MCKVKMFGTWLRADTSASYTKLARAFVAVGNRTIAEALCSARGTKVTLFDVCMYTRVYTVVGEVDIVAILEVQYSVVLVK